MKVPPDVERAVARQGKLLLPVVPVPLCPSTNELFLATGKRRVKSPQYRKWLEQAMRALVYLAPPEAYPCRAELVVRGKINQSRDIDNLIKPVLDACVKAGVIEDDNARHVGRVDIRYEPGDKPAVIEVSFGPLNPEGK